MAERPPLSSVSLVRILEFASSNPVETFLLFTRLVVVVSDTGPRL